MVRSGKLMIFIFIVILCGGIIIAFMLRDHVASTKMKHVTQMQQTMYKLEKCVMKDKHLPSLNYTSNLTQGYLVPNIAHYNWFTNKTKDLKFHELLSLLSAHQVMKAEKIFFHHNMEPTGQYWQEAKNKIPNLVLVPREPPDCVFGLKLKQPHYETSNSDADRLLLLHEYGGVYLDLDIVITTSLDPLRVYPATVGFEFPGAVCGGFIMSAPHSTFLYLWINQMLEDYRVDRWTYISGHIPSILVKRYEHTGIVHVEKWKIHYPNYVQTSKLLGPRKIKWTDHYAVHLWYRLWQYNKHWTQMNKVPSPKTIKKMDNVFGQIARMIYYGSAKMF